MITKRFAVYKSLEYDFDTIQEIPDGEDDFLLKGYVRVSEIEEVTFTPRNEEETRTAAVESIEAKKGEIISDFSEKILKWDEKKRQLLALTGPTASTDDDIPF